MSEPIRSSCSECRGTIFWIEGPQDVGGWWSHEVHPADDHDADPDMAPECCDYRDHAVVCACPEHEHSEMHPFGGGEERWGKPPTGDD